MWRLLDRFFFVIFLFSFFVFGEDFERLCHEEILKEDFNVTIIKTNCLKVAQRYEQKANLENASWYYILSMNFAHNFTYQEDENSSFLFYINQGHTHVLNNDFKKTKIAYENVLTFDIDIDKDVQKDYIILMKLYPKKIEALEKGLKIWNHANKTFLKIIALNEAYNKLYDDNQYNLMIQKLKQIINLKKETILKNSISHMMDYYHLASIHEKRKHYKKAIDNYIESLNISKNILYHPKHGHIGTIYNSLGLVYHALKVYEQAEIHYIKALDIYRKEYGKEDESIAIIYNNLATIYGDKEKYKDAISYYNKALKIEKKNHSTHIIQTYYNLGLLYQQMREYEKVLPFYQKALAFIDNNNSAMATHYTLKGAYYQEIEENKKALFFYEKALKIRQAEGGEYHTDTAESYNSIGSIYEALKDFEQALVFYKKALKINQVLLDKNDNFIAIGHNNIASIYVNLERYQEAKDSLLRTLKIKESILEKEDIDFAVTFTNLGFIYEKLHEDNNASHYYAHALAIYSKNKGANSLEVAIVKNHIASLYKEQKNYPTALKYLEEAKNIIESILDKNHTQRSLIYNNLGLLYIYNGLYKKAYQYNSLSFNIFLHNRNKNFEILDSKQKSLYLHSFGNRIDNLYDAAYLYFKEIEEPTTSKVLLETILSTWFKYKGTLFEYQNILSMVKSNPKTTNEIKKIIQTLNALNRQSAKEEENQEVKKKIHNIEIKLSQHNDAFRELLKLKNINHKQIASKLTPHQIYIDFMRGTDNYYIFTLDHKEQITFQQIETNETNSIDKYIYAYLDNTKNMAKYIENQTLQQHQEKSKKEAKVILEKLSNLLIQNYLQEHIQEKKQLIISTDGLLNYFPFEALYHKGQYLIEKYTINYISSAKEFIRQIKLNPKNAKVTMAIFAHADFNATLKSYTPEKVDSTLAGRFANQTKPTVPLIEQQHFSPLDDSEINIIKRYYPKAKIYRDKNATVHNLISMESSKILHLSTHGLFLEEKNIMNPMKKSVLVFAGANQARLQGNQEGIISALKLSTLNLQSTELVVLSACQSGLGDIQNAEGIIGLPKALIQAGAKNVIMSLWTVSSHKTTTLMDYFYASLSEKQDYTTALQTAKIKMIKMHPYYWSAFILSGI